jgi:hypothetical protein
MYHTTGFTRDEIRDICARIDAVELEPGTVWPAILGMFNSVVVALTYMRRNRVQAEIAETFGVSQPTISRAVTVITPLIETALAEFVPTADELDPGTPYIVDGTLLPCWSWRIIENSIRRNRVRSPRGRNRGTCEAVADSR